MGPHTARLPRDPTLTPPPWDPTVTTPSHPEGPHGTPQVLPLISLASARLADSTGALPLHLAAAAGRWDAAGTVVQALLSVHPKAARVKDAVGARMLARRSSSARAHRTPLLTARAQRTPPLTAQAHRSL